MGFFYFDESIHTRGEFIIGAFVYSEADVSDLVFKELESVGLKPGRDEYKSGARMAGNNQFLELRSRINEILFSCKVGLVIVPLEKRELLGEEAIKCLEKVINANDLSGRTHQAFFDQEISVGSATLERFRSSKINCEIYLGQDSKNMTGIQLADLAAHSCSIMLLEHMGLIKKKIRAGENSGYDRDVEIDLGFELWTSLRYTFFKGAPELGEDFKNEDLVFDVESHGLFISQYCNAGLRSAAIARFGKCYMGCIH